jgi:hypothetical protein
MGGRFDAFGAVMVMAYLALTILLASRNIGTEQGDSDG